MPPLRPVFLVGVGYSSLAQAWALAGHQRSSTVCVVSESVRVFCTAYDSLSEAVCAVFRVVRKGYDRLRVVVMRLPLGGTDAEGRGAILILTALVSAVDGAERCVTSLGPVVCV